MNEYEKEDLANILSGRGSWFHAKLLRLISTADQEHRRKLYTAFPEEVDAVHKFQTGKDYTSDGNKGNRDDSRAEEVSGAT